MRPFFRIPPGGLALLVVLGTACCGFAHAEVSIKRQDGVEIITSKSTPVLKPAVTVSTSASAVSSVGAAAPRQPDATLAGPARAVVAASTADPFLVAPGDPFAQAIRGDHRLRANLLKSDGTPNEESDNEAHRLVRAREAKAQAELKDNLQAFDTARRRGAPRDELARVHERIQADLDVIDMLARSQQNLE